MKKFLICIMLVLALSACSRDHIIHFNLSQQPDTLAKPSYVGRSHFFFWGVGQKANYDLTKVCTASGIKSLETLWTWQDSLIGSLTMGIYAPESFAIYCN